MSNVVPADRSAASKASDFGRGVGYDSSKTSGGETLTARTGSAGEAIEDAGGYTAETTVEAALQEIYGRLPFSIDQGADLIIDTTVGVGTDLRATSLVAPVLASTRYEVRATVYLTGTANSGYKFGFTAPSAATLAWTSTIYDAADSTIISGENAIADSEGATAAITFVKVEIHGLLIVDATAGNLTFVAAQNADHADDTVVHLESTLTVTKVQ